MSQPERPKPGEVSIDHWMAYIDRSLAQITVDLGEVKRIAADTDNTLHRNGQAVLPRLERVETSVKEILQSFKDSTLEKRTTWQTIKRGFAVSIPTALVAATLAYGAGSLRSTPTPQPDYAVALKLIQERLDGIAAPVVDTTYAEQPKPVKSRKPKPKGQSSVMAAKMKGKLAELHIWADYDLPAPRDPIPGEKDRSH